MDQTSSTEPIGESSAETPRKTGAGKVPVIIAILAVIAAVIFGALYFISRVPDGAAAKVNDTYINESDVNAYIAQYRTSHQLTDDSALAQALSSQNLTVSQFRINAIDQLAITQLVNARAEELGVTPSDGEVQEQIDEMKSSIAMGDDSTWEQTLQSYGMTEDQVREQYRNSLAQRAVCEKEVPRREATDSEALAFAKQNLAGSEQKHYYRIVFSGDNQTKRAQECSKKISAASEGGLTLPEFQRIAKDYANDKNGSYKWSLELESSDGVDQSLSSLVKGAASDPESVSADDAVEIFYCDSTYTFPGTKSINSLKKSDVPKSLWSAVKAKAADSVWNSDCSSYVAKLLAQAKITYYPMPEGASYDVDPQSASSSE